MNIRLIASTTVAIFLIIAGFLGWRFLQTADRIHIENDSSKTSFENIFSLLPGKEREKLRGEDTDRINILLLGRAGEKYPGKNLTDTVMLASIDTETRRVGFLSLPRDLFVPIPETDLATKLNSLYQYGLSRGDGANAVIATVEHVTGQTIPYFVILDFDGFERIIDDLGGIRIENMRDIRDTRYPGKNYSYETFELSAGWHDLDGATALKYARERHSDPEGDFGRAKRQQEIIKAAQEKAFSATTYLNALTLDRLLRTLGESVRTNLSVAEMVSLAELGRTTDLRNASTAIIDAWKRESLLRVSHIDVSGTRAFILVPRIGDWSEIRDIAENIFDQNALRERQERVSNERPDILLVSRPEHATETSVFARTLASSFTGASIRTKTSASLTKTTESAIMDMTSLRKPYSLDALLKITAAEKTDFIPQDVRTIGSAKADTDFIAVLGEDFFGRTFSETTLDETGKATTGVDDVFSDFLEPQPRQ
jgi:LCP family protein required for cell wall assembly